MNDYNSWYHLQKKFLKSTGWKTEPIENGFYMKDYTGTYLWDWNFHSDLKPLFSDCDFFYPYILNDETTGLIHYYIEFKFQDHFYHIRIGKRGNTFVCEFDERDEMFNTKCTFVSKFNVSDEIYVNLFHKANEVKKYVFNLPKYRLKFLFNEFRSNGFIEFEKYMIEKGLFEKITV